MMYRLFSLFLALGSFCNIALSQVTVRSKDRLAPLEGTVQFRGYVAGKMERSMEGRILPADINRLVLPFASRSEKDFGGWRCEYWGKWTTSASLAASYYQTPEAIGKIKEAARKLMGTQTNNGYIGTYGQPYELGGWDVWGRKYVLLGLIQVYDVTKDPAVLSAARRELDYTIEQLDPAGGKARIADNGLDLLESLPPSSILEPVCLLYQRTGEPRYKNFAASIVDQWSKPSKLNPNGINLVGHALAGTTPSAISSAKAYEMMSCFEGLCEWYRITGDKRYLDAVTQFANTLLKKEITIVGSGSDQELWANTARLQTGLLQEPMETCVTVTWMKLCNQLLRLTGDPKWADQMEVSLYNALLGAMTPDGKWWSYFSPLEGERVPSSQQHEDMHLSCCVANGPRGVFLTPKWSAMQGETGMIINLYEDATYRETIRGVSLTAKLTGGYPRSGNIVIEVESDKDIQVGLSLRIPSWSERSMVRVNGVEQKAVVGTYLTLKRKWKKGDRIEVELDMRGRLVPAPSGAPFLAVMRGPIVLALDSRVQPAVDTAVAFVPDWARKKETSVREKGYQYTLPFEFPSPESPQQYVQLNEMKAGDSIWMAFETEVLVRPRHYFNHHSMRMRLVDYASAGNAFSNQNQIRVWMPMPLRMIDMYRKDLWRMQHSEEIKRPEIPEKW